MGKLDLFTCLKLLIFKIIDQTKTINNKKGGIIKLKLFDKVYGFSWVSAELYGVLNANVITTNKNVAIADNPYPNIEAFAGPLLLNKILIITPPPNNPNKLIILWHMSFI